MVPDLKGEHRRGGWLSKLINEIDKIAKKMKNPGTGSELGSGNMIRARWEEKRQWRLYTQEQIWGIAKQKLNEVQ